MARTLSAGDEIVVTELDRDALGADVLLTSPYKYFEPRLGVAAVRRVLARSLPADRVRPAAERPYGHRFETGTSRMKRSPVWWRPSSTWSRCTASRTRTASPSTHPRSASTSTDGAPQLCRELGKRGLFTDHGNYYALGAMTGLEASGGAVRAGYLHYTTLDEVDRLSDTLGALS